jgi:hypothetical protein
MKYKATYHNSSESFQTHWYSTAEEAQDKLMNRIGGFQYLGTVNGDGIWDGEDRCYSAPRNGGAVGIDEKTK